MATMVASTVTVTRSAVSAAATATQRAASQGGVLEGLDPTEYDSAHPIVLFIIQVCYCQRYLWARS